MWKIETTSLEIKYEKMSNNECKLICNRTKMDIEPALPARQARLAEAKTKRTLEAGVFFDIRFQENSCKTSYNIWMIQILYCSALVSHSLQTLINSTFYYIQKLYDTMYVLSLPVFKRKLEC